MYITKIKVNDKIIELTDCCTWEVKDGVLYNYNTNRDEGVDGDIVRYKNCKIYYYKYGIFFKKQIELYSLERKEEFK